MAFQKICDEDDETKQSLQSVVISFFNIDALIVLFYCYWLEEIEILKGSQETKQLRE